MVVAVWGRQNKKLSERGEGRNKQKVRKEHSMIIAIKYLIYRLSQEEHWPKDAIDYSGTSIWLEI